MNVSSEANKLNNVPSLKIIPPGKFIVPKSIYALIITLEIRRALRIQIPLNNDQGDREYCLVATKYGRGGPPKIKTVVDHPWLTPPFLIKYTVHLW